ncbi:MAG: uracil-DNA glycosylase [Actinobacteria bacterium]|nr:uracil-DNA glycosylase [Actinomycetota bacterium]
MKVCDYIKCKDIQCKDINADSYLVSYKRINPLNIQIFMITEAPPADEEDYFYAKDNPFYLKTTIQAFNDAGVYISTMQEILDLGIYITTAIKCGKIQYAISTNTIKNCTKILEKEVNLFPNIRVFLLMGDVAIKAMNYIWKKQVGKKIIPSGSTYKIRNQEYYYKEKRVFPSYTPTGKNYLIEKSKRRMIAEDIKEAMKLIQ